MRTLRTAKRLQALREQRSSWFGGHRPLTASYARRLNLDRSADFDVIVE